MATPINALPEAVTLEDNDRLLIEQAGVARKLTGRTLKNALAALAQGHGGIDGIEKIAAVGLIDTYRIRYTDGNHFDFSVRNGTGRVSTVAGVSPDSSGNVALTASDMKTSENISVEQAIGNANQAIANAQQAIENLAYRETLSASGNGLYAKLIRVGNVYTLVIYGGHTEAALGNDVSILSFQGLSLGMDFQFSSQCAVTKGVYPMMLDAAGNLKCRVALPKDMYLRGTMTFVK